MPADRSAAFSWRCFTMTRRRLPTRRFIHTAKGMAIREKRVSRQSSTIIATSDMVIPAAEETICVITEVTTACMEPMSEKMRDWISPVRVRVKKPRPIRCRCP